MRILWKLFFLPTSYKFQKSLRPQVEKVICITRDWASNEYTLSASAIICVNNADLIPPYASQSDCHCRGVKDLIFSLMPVRQDTVRALLLSSLFQTLFHLWIHSKLCEHGGTTDVGLMHAKITLPQLYMNFSRENDTCMTTCGHVTPTCNPYIDAKKYNEIWPLKLV